MKISINREEIIKQLQLINNCIPTKHQIAILSNVLMQVEGDLLTINGTDLEIEMLCQIRLSLPAENGRVTIPSKKLLDIIRGLPVGSQVNITSEGDRVVISSGRSRYNLNTLNANDYPSLKEFEADTSFNLAQNTLKQLIDSTQFAMAQQDIRFYLNGLLLEIDNEFIRTVATDGHRLAMSEIPMDNPIDPNAIIIPRKSILELNKLLENVETTVNIKVNAGNLQANFGDTIFTTKLIDGKYPDYRRTLPKSPDKIVTIETEIFKQALNRANVLSNERFKGVRLTLNQAQVVIQTNNPEHEEAEEVLDIQYDGPEIEIGLNIVYLLDVLNVIKTGEIIIQLTDTVSSVLVTDKQNDKNKYIIMPMRL